MPVWLSYPPRRSGGVGAAARASAKHCLVFFVPGNPGFVDYYAPFLSTLRTLLDEAEDASAGSSSSSSSSSRPVRFHLVGRNLLGFEDGDDGGGAYGPGPYDLDTQIRACVDAVSASRVDLGPGSDADPRHGSPFDEVVLVGHSVGSYIALDAFRRLQQQRQTTSASSSSAPRLRLGILLFATLVHLARSPRGRPLARVLAAPLLGAYAPLAAAAFLWCWPVWALGWVVRRVLAFPPHAAAVTVRFLASRGGVRQALHLARDELREIAEDRWEDELWEAADEADGDDRRPPKFVILFGKDDHWVADDMRDEFVARRAAHKRGRARIVLDERGLPHDFCIRHGEEVAEMVKVWLAELVEAS